MSGAGPKAIGSRAPRGCGWRIGGVGLPGSRSSGRPRRRQPSATAHGLLRCKSDRNARLARCLAAPSARARRGIVRETVRFQRLRVLFALVVREMNTKFGRSYGGYIWAIAEPLGGVMLLNLAFSLTVRRPPLGTNFPLFYATGIVPFFLFTGVSGAVASAVATNRGLLHYPVVSPLDAVFGKFILELPDDAGDRRLALDRDHHRLCAAGDARPGVGADRLHPRRSCSGSGSARSTACSSGCSRPGATSGTC